MRVIKMVQLNFMVIVKKFQERFYYYKFSQPCAVGVINECHVFAIPVGIVGGCRCREKDVFEEINNSKKIYIFEIMPTYKKLLQNIELFIACYNAYIFAHLSVTVARLL